MPLLRSTLFLFLSLKLCVPCISSKHNSYLMWCIKASVLTAVTEMAWVVLRLVVYPHVICDVSSWQELSTDVAGHLLFVANHVGTQTILGSKTGLTSLRKKERISAFIQIWSLLAPEHSRWSKLRLQNRTSQTTVMSQPLGPSFIYRWYISMLHYIIRFTCISVYIYTSIICTYI